jgi:hypothetical protein
VTILNFRDARANRETPVPTKRISDDALAALRTGAEINVLQRGTKADIDLFNALVELQDIREEKRRGF